MAKAAPAKPTASADAVQAAEVTRKYPIEVRARTRCYYGQIREEGEKFANDLDLPVYPEDPHSNIEAVQD
jgi:hypothetical protein